jgi:hypothetical protein
MMQIELKFPYSEDWKCGYLVTGRENRKNVILYKRMELKVNYFDKIKVIMSSRYRNNFCIKPIDNENFDKDVLDVRFISYFDISYAVAIDPKGQFLSASRGAISWWPQRGEDAEAVYSKMRSLIDNEYSRISRKRSRKEYIKKLKNTLTCGLFFKK